MLDKKKKDKLIAKYRTHATDTGSPQVQIAILSEEMKELAEHLTVHKKDFSSRRGLLKKVGERRRLLRYLEREDAKSFEDLTKKLKIKISRRKMEEPPVAVIEEIAAEEPLEAVV
ncbi:30S ribosomal protein S15 [Candidatus Uhrbacteria bacterium]|nr:30S ribosomal protein S15 [Candidatus Uhrbacteria bacterium]